jgi:hypothetical protein
LPAARPPARAAKLNKANARAVEGSLPTSPPPSPRHQEVKAAHVLLARAAASDAGGGAPGLTALLTAEDVR